MMKVLDYTNNISIFILISSVIMIIFSIIFCLINRKNEGFINLIVSLELEGKTVLTEIIVIVFLIVILKTVINMNVITILNLNEWWKQGLSLYVIKHYYSIIKNYKYLKNWDYIDNIKKGNSTIDPRRSIENRILSCNSELDLQKEYLGILKTLAPVSLMPLIAGFIFGNTSINIEWNKYTIVFSILICLYFCIMYSCFSKIKVLQNRIVELKKVLRDLE